MRDEITVKLVHCYRVAWWCRQCWQRGELLVARGVEPYRIQRMADNLHFWNPWNCPVQRVKVEYDARKPVKIPRGKLFDYPLTIQSAN